jgi:hypothetical protein
LPPLQQQPQALPSAPQAAPSPAQQASPLLVLPLAVEANTDSFLVRRTEPQRGHFVPLQSLERTRISLSLSHLSQ